MSMQRFREGLLLGLSPQAADVNASLYKKDAPAPDYTALADAAREYSGVMKELGTRQQDMAQAQFDRLSPIVEGIAKTQIETQNQLNEQGRDYYNYQKETFRPVEKALIDEVNQYNTGAERERQAGQAAADIQRQAAIQDDVTSRQMAAMGVNPNSGKFQALKRQNSLQTAARRAGAMTAARNNARNLGYAKRMDVVGMGRNLPGASVAAYGTALNAGNSAAANYQSPSNTLMAGYSAGTNTIAQGAAAPMAAQGTILGNQVSRANAVDSMNANFLGTAAGTALGAAAVFG
jgi:hypothetical protein